MADSKKLGFIVDFDGTILDDLDLVPRTIDNFAKYYDIEVDQAKKEKIHKIIYEDTSNNSSKWNMIKLFLMVAKELGIPIRKRIGSLKIAEQSYNEEAAKCKIIPNVREALATLKKAGTIGLLTTSSKGEVVLRLDKNIDILDIFEDKVITGDMVKSPKPHPEGIYKLTENWNIETENIFMIGDMVTDIIVAKKFGCKTIAVLTGYGKKKEFEKYGADIILNSLSEIGTILDSIKRC